MDVSLVEVAVEIALRAHHGQENKHNGEPYILHVFRVAKACRKAGLGYDAQAVAWLHDVVEDTRVTLSDLHRAFPTNPEIVVAVDALTKVSGESNLIYYTRLQEIGGIAAAVKVRDIQDNFSRNHLIDDEQTRLRMAHKYSLGLSMLKDYA